MPTESPRIAARHIVPHVDDLGASHGANQAFLDLARRGLVTCGSVMVPGAWFREIADAAIADPGRSTSAFTSR